METKANIYPGHQPAFSNRRIQCPECKARRGFAPLIGDEASGKCFACGAFLPSDNFLQRRDGKSARLNSTEQYKPVLLDATPSRLWATVPVAATYDYHDEDGALLFQIDRKERQALYRYPDGAERWEREKTFIQRPANAARAYQGCMNGVRRVLYRLPCVLQAIRNGWPVVVVEGEKDADAYNDLFREELAYDARATCCPGGAGKWLTYGTSYNTSLHGGDVILDGDMDSAGLLHIRTVANALQGIARRVRIVSDLYHAVEQGVR